MGVCLTFIDLPEPRHLVPEPPPREEPARLALDVRLKSKLGAGKHTNSHARVVYRDKTARYGVGKACVDTSLSPTFAGRDATSSRL